MSYKAILYKIKLFFFNKSNISYNFKPNVMTKNLRKAQDILIRKPKTE